MKKQKGLPERSSHYGNGKETISQCVYILNSPDHELRLSAVRTLALLCASSHRHVMSASEDYHTVVGALTDALEDKNPEIRYAAQEGLKRLRE